MFALLGANLAGAHLTRADLAGANLYGVDLALASGVPSYLYDPE